MKQLDKRIAMERSLGYKRPVKIWTLSMSWMIEHIWNKW